MSINKLALLGTDERVLTEARFPAYRRAASWSFNVGSLVGLALTLLLFMWDVDGIIAVPTGIAAGFLACHALFVWSKIALNEIYLSIDGGRMWKDLAMWALLAAVCAPGAVILISRWMS